MNVNVPGHEIPRFRQRGHRRTLAVGTLALCLLGFAVQSRGAAGPSDLAFVASSASGSGPTSETQPDATDRDGTAPPMIKVATGAPGEAGRAAVPPGFHPSGVSFINQAQGWVIGESPCGEASCIVLLRTQDGGLHWEPIAAPETHGESERTRSADYVSDIRFADERNGWVFNRALWVTHDGGATWRAAHLGNPVLALEVTAGNVYALVASCELSLAECTGPVRVLEAQVGSDQWRSVLEVEMGSPPVPNGQLVVSGPAVYLSTHPYISSPRGGEPPLLFARTAAGGWERRRMPSSCAWGGVLAASGPDDLVFACQTAEGGLGQAPNELHASADRGDSWTRIGNDSFPGHAMIVAATPQERFLVLSTEQLLIDRPDGRQASVRFNGSGGYSEPIRSIHFTTTQHGVVLTGNSSQGRVYVTRDAWVNWGEISFQR